MIVLCYLTPCLLPFPLVQVLHANIDYVRACPPLLHFLRELEGSEAPEQY